MKTWYSIQNKAGSAEILIYDVIGKDFWGEGVGAKEFAQEVSNLKVSTINVRINSPGGQVFEGTAIYNTLVNHPARITVAIDGMALSAASFIAMAGDHISMAENAMMMIHDPWGMAVGTAEDMRKQAGMMDKAKVNIIKTYQNQVDKKDQELSDMMAAETWLTADEALVHGFIHEVTGAMKMAASYDKRILTNYRHVPATLTNHSNKGRSISMVQREVQMLELENNTERSVNTLKKEIQTLEAET